MDREIALLVQESARLAATDGVDKEEAEKPLLSAVELLRQAESAAGFPELQAPENYLLCAEAALGVDNVSLAHSCLESFLHARPAKNQFLVRAYFALGKVQAAYCDGLKSTELLEGTMAALAQVQHGLQLAAELGAAHRFLVYNGSVHLWNVARPLMALPTTAAALVPVLEATIKALEVAQEADSSWRLQLSMALARCMEAAGKRKEAGAMLGTCGGLAKERRETEQLLQLQLHMLAEDAGAAKKLRDDNASKPRLKGLLTAQALRDAAAPPPTAAEEIIDAMGAVDKEFAAALRAEGGAPAVQAAMLELRGSCDEADVLLALATQAVECGLLDLADHAANRCAMATELGARVRAGYVREAVRVKRLDDGSNGPPQGEVYTRLMVGTRVDGLKRLEEGLASARRTGDAELVTDGCVLAWNIAMPLLQPSLYHHAVGILSASASALEEIGSPKHELRVMLHLEIARAEAEAEFYKKAAQHAEAALKLDVPLDARGERPLDVPLLQMRTKLALKTDIYRDAETPEEKAMLLLEQVQNAKQPRLAQRLVSQMQTMMAASEPPPRPAAPTEEEAAAAEEGAAAAADPTPESVRVERAHLWGGLMKTAWAQRLVEPSRAAAAALLAVRFEPEAAREVVRLQTEARFVEGESSIAMMQEEQKKAVTLQELADNPVGAVAGAAAKAEKGAQKARESALELRAKALTEFEAGVALGRALGEDVLVHNGCTYVWNYSQEALRAAEYAPLLPSLSACVEALQGCAQPPLKADVQLLKLCCALASALAIGLEHGATAPPEPPKTSRVPSKDAEAAAALKQADAACRWASELSDGRPRLKKAATSVWARLQAHAAYAGAKEPSVGPEPEASARALLELLASQLLEGEPARAAALAKAKELLRGGEGGPKPEPELWALAARQALALGDLASVVEACEAALAPLRAAPKGSKVLKDEWRWYALAEVTHGEAIEKLLKPDQNLQLQLQLHAQALGHLAQAMAHANRAGIGAMCVSAAERFWPHCKALMASTNPGALRAPVGVALKELQELEAALQPQVVELRVRLYEAMLGVLAAARDWPAGLALLTRAFGSLPSHAHQPLWEQKVTFMCKGGANKKLMGEMFRLKDFPPEVQARVWSVLGANAPGQGEQLTAMMRSVEALQSGEALAKVDYLISLAEWLYCNGFPLRDAEDQLLTAVDILMDCEEEAPDEEEEGAAAAADDGASVASLGSKSARSVASRATSVASSAATTTTVGTARGGDGKGGGGATELTVLHFEQLARIYTMLAQMAPSAHARTEQCLMAHHYLARMWASAVGAANAAEAAAPPPAAPAGLEPLAEGEAGPPYALPLELHEWATWTPPARLCRLMAAAGAAGAKEATRYVCAATVPTPHLTAFYLRYCAGCLSAAGLALHALLPLSLLRVVAADVLAEPAMARLAALQTAQLLHQLGAAAPAAALRAELGRLAPSAEQQRLNQLTLKQIAEAKAAASSAAHTKPAEPAGALVAADGAAPRPRPKSASRSAEACWVDVAALLLDEGEWAAAQAWLLEAKPLLVARDDADYVARANLLLARAAALQGDTARALSLQREAMRTPLEVGEWAQAIESLAAYQSAAADEGGRSKTLGNAIEVCAAAATAYANSAPDVLAAQAALQCAFARVWRDKALGLKAAGVAYAAELRQGSTLLEAAAETLQGAGASAALAECLLQRAEMVDALPPPPANAAELALEAEAEHLNALLELLTAAAAAAGRVLALAAPRTLPAELSLPAARRLGALKVRLARLELRLAAHRNKVAASLPPPQLSYPEVEGRDAAAVAAFMTLPPVASSDTHMTHEERALLQATSGAALGGAGHSGRARALLASGEALLAIARAKGWGAGAWDQPPPPPPPPTEAELAEAEAGAAAGAAPSKEAAAAAAGEEEAAEAPPRPPPPGSADAAQGEARLREAAQLALEEGDRATAQQAALALAGASGVARAPETAQWLCLAQSCAARRHWLGVWRGACGASDRLALLAKLVAQLQARWTRPETLAAAAGALAILEDDGAQGCAVWRALRVPLDPLGALLPLLKADTRVLQLCVGEDGASLLGCVLGVVVTPTEVKGAEPTTALQCAVSRAELPAAALRELGAAAGAVRALQSKAALARTRDALLRAAPGGEAPPAGVPPDKAPEEEALRSLAAALDLALTPLLAPLLPLLGPGPPVDEVVPAIGVVVVADPQLAALPLELLPALRLPHVAMVSRDLSVAVLGHRLGREAPPCKKAAWGYAVDARHEVQLPFDDDLVARVQSNTKKEKGAKAKGAAAPDEGEPAAEAYTQSLCDAFEADVLDGGRVAYGKEWPRTGLLGARQVPSAVDMQRCLLGSSGFVYLGPGPLLAQLPPAHLAPLKLHGVGAALLLDRAEGDASSRRLAKEDNKKDARRLALEEPHTTAALLSLAGVHSVVFNQWAATAADNREMLGATLDHLGGGGTLADALGAARAGLVIHPPPPPGEEGSQPPTEDGSRPVTAGSGSRPGTAASKGSKGSKKASPPGKSPKGTPRGKKGKGAESPREVVAKPTVWGVSANAVVYGVPQAFTLS